MATNKPNNTYDSWWTDGLNMFNYITRYYRYMGRRGEYQISPHTGNAHSWWQHGFDVLWLDPKVPGCWHPKAGVQLLGCPTHGELGWWMLVAPDPSPHVASCWGSPSDSRQLRPCTWTAQRETLRRATRGTTVSMSLGPSRLSGSVWWSLSMNHCCSIVATTMINHNG